MQAIRPAVCSIQPPIQLSTANTFPGVKRQEPEANHSRPSSGDVKNMLSYISTDPSGFMPSYLDKYGDNTFSSSSNSDAKNMLSYTPTDPSGFMVWYNTFRSSFTEKTCEYIACLRKNLFWTSVLSKLVQVAKLLALIRGFQFEFRPQRRLFWLGYSWFFSVAPWQSPGEYPRLGRDSS
jgi:hypothetical protein